MQRQIINKLSCKKYGIANDEKYDKNYSKTIPITPTPAVIIVRVCRQPYRISDI